MTKKRANSGAQVSQRLPLKRRKIEEDDSESSDFSPPSPSSSSFDDEEEEDEDGYEETQIITEKLKNLFPPSVPTLSDILDSDLNNEAKIILIRRFFEVMNRIDEDTPSSDIMLIWSDFNKVMDEMRTGKNGSSAELDSFITILENYRRAFLPNLQGILSSVVSWDKKTEALEIFRLYHDSDINSMQRMELARRYRKIIKVDDKYYTRRLKIQNLNTSERKKEALLKLLDREAEDDHAKSKIEWYLNLPYENNHSISSEGLSEICSKVYDFLEKEVYGLRDAKEAILRYVNDHFRGCNKGKKQILALKGNPGTGKTKIASTIAKAVGLPFQKISMGGVGDATILRGSSAVWLGSEPSLLLQKLISSKCCNPVILFDEIDKISTHGHGKEVHHTLLHILDYEQNSEVQDCFLSEISHDFSHAWFIVTMNDDSFLDPALKDRLRIIEVPDYTKEDVVKIVQNYTLPKFLRERNFQEKDISFTDAALVKLMNILFQERGQDSGGMRSVESKISDIISRISLWNIFEKKEKLNYKVPGFSGFPYVVSENSLEKIMKDEGKNKEKAFHPMYL